MTIELDNVTSGYNLSVINKNFQTIEDKMNDEVLWRAETGVAGEAKMERDLDMDGHRILNADIDASTLTNDRAVRISDLEYLPAIAQTDAERRGKLISFDINTGAPITLAPSSGSALDVLNQLALPTGAGLVGYKLRQSANAVLRTVQDKLDDFVFLEDYGGKANDISVDNSIAFTKAFAESPRVKLRNPGVYYMKTRDVVLPANWYIEGSGFNTELKYPGTDTTFTMFTANGTGPEDANQIQGGVFKDVVISSDVPLAGAFVFRHLKHALWERCFFYNAGTLMDNFHYIDYIFCQRWGSPFYGAATLNTEKHISEMPRWLNCFSSNSPIDLVDTTDALLAHSIFYNGEFVVRQRYTAPALGTTDKGYGFPIHITHCVMDAVRGSALDLDRVAYFTITGNLISAGRDLVKDGVLITNGDSGTFTGNVITYCGAFGLRMVNMHQCAFDGNVYNGNQSGGVSISTSKLCTFSSGAMGTSYIYGGYYVQPVGFTDPANSCTDLTLIGIQFDDDQSLKVSLNTNDGTNNRILACRGVEDTVIVSRGGTAQRPSAPKNGQQYYDTNLGFPIWWNGVTLTWKNAAGIDA